MSWYPGGYSIKIYALQGDKILCSCSAKIVYTIARSSPIKYALTRDKIFVRESCYKR